MAATPLRTVARAFVQQLQHKMRELVSENRQSGGRYYAMDRDNRWERVELAYRALVHGERTLAPMIPSPRCSAVTSRTLPMNSSNQL